MISHMHPSSARSLVFVLWMASSAISFTACDNRHFYDLISHPYFVDKSELLMEVFNKTSTIPPPKTPWNFSSLNYYYITRPRGFGKTTNLKMIQHFAQYELDEERCNVTKAYNLTKAYEEFGKLKVSKWEQFVSDNLGQYSVVYLDLTFRVDDLVSNENAANAYGAKFADVFRPYEWFLSNVTQEGAHLFLENLLAGKADPNWIHRAAFYVCKTLNRIGGKGTIFLLDNFDSAARLSVSSDAPLKGVAYLYTTLHKTLREYADFVRTENAEHRRNMCLISGISEMRFNTENFKTNQMFRRSMFLKYGIFSPYFGFVQQEVDALVDKFNCTEDEKSEVQRYYKGYKTDSNEIYLYNPVSVVGYLESKRIFKGAGKLEPYWARNESLDYVVQFAKVPWFRNKLTELVTKNEIRIASPVQEHDSNFLLSFFDWSEREYEYITEDDAPYLLYYFYEHGFLRHKVDSPWYAFEFANVEVQTEIERRLIEMRVLV